MYTTHMSTMIGPTLQPIGGLAAFPTLVDGL